MKKYSYKTLLLIGVLLLITNALHSQSRTCISGNCENGSGRIKIPEYSNRELQGYFINGNPEGETKIYLSDGSLFYTGPVKNFLPEGKGKIFSGKYLWREGVFKNGSLISGTTYDDKAMAIASGEFEPGDFLKLKKGFRTLSFRSNICYLFCDDIRDGVLNGLVQIRERTPSPKEGRLLSEATYLNGKIEGIAKEWDYENGVYHSILYKNGAPYYDASHPSVIYRISDHATIGIGVKYTGEATMGGDMLNNISYGVFTFADQPEILEYPGGASLSKYKQLYNAPQQVVVARPSSTEPRSSMKSDPKYASYIEEFRKVLETNTAKEEKMMSIYRSTSKKNYWKSQEDFNDLLDEILKSYREALEKYRGKVRLDLLNIMIKRKNDAGKIRFPLRSEF